MGKATEAIPKPGAMRGKLAFTQAWRASRDDFAFYVTTVSQAYTDSHLSLDTAARLAGATPTEVWAVLRMASLDEKLLELFAGPPPPKTTWLTFADADEEGIRAGLKALKALQPGQSAARAVEEALHDVKGPDASERVAGLPAATLQHMAEKAKQYSTFEKRHLNFLKNMAKQRRFGQPMSMRQTAYLQSLLEQMVTAGAVSRNSPDKDQTHCDAVLDALGQ